MGYNLKKDDLRGGRRHPQWAGTQGGGSGRIEHAGADVRWKSTSAMDFDSVAKAGSMLGSGGVVVLDDTNCIVKFALAHHEVLPA